MGQAVAFLVCARLVTPDVETGGSRVSMRARSGASIAARRVDRGWFDRQPDRLFLEHALQELEHTLRREIEAWKRLIRKLGRQTANNEIRFTRGQRRPWWRECLETHMGVPIPDSYVAALTVSDGFRVFLLDSENCGVHASLLGFQDLRNFGAFEPFPGDDGAVFVPAYSREICWGFRVRSGVREADPPMYRQDDGGNLEPEPGGTLAEVLEQERVIFAEDFASFINRS